MTTVLLLATSFCSMRSTYRAGEAFETTKEHTIKNRKNIFFLNFIFFFVLLKFVEDRFVELA